MTDKKRRSRDWAGDWRARGEQDGYFDDLYRAAGGDASQIPWADLEPNAHLLAWLDAVPAARPADRRVLVLGCGLGDDAEELARRGGRVTAFDLSPAAIDWTRRRFPESPVDYRVADLFDLPSDWRGAFDLVVEIYTLGVLPAHRRPTAYRLAADCVAPGGRFLVICRLAGDGDSGDDVEAAGPPWPLAPAELRSAAGPDFELTDWDEILDTKDEPPVQRVRLVWCRGRRPDRQATDDVPYPEGK